MSNERSTDAHRSYPEQALQPSDLALFCWKTKWFQLCNMRSTQGAEPFRCLHSNVSSEHETQPEFKESRVQQPTRLIPCFDKAQSKSPSADSLCFAELVTQYSRVSLVLRNQTQARVKIIQPSPSKIRGIGWWLNPSEAGGWIQTQCGQGEGNCTDADEICETKCRPCSETLVKSTTFQYGSFFSSMEADFNTSSCFTDVQQKSDRWILERDHIIIFSLWHEQS